MKNEWREKYVSTIREISDFLKNLPSTITPPSHSPLKTFSPRSLSPYKTPQSPDKTPPPSNRFFRRERIASFITPKLDLTSLEVLEKLHKRLKNMLRIKKSINQKSDREKCEENSAFLNSLLEDRKKRFCIVKRPISGGQNKIIGVVRDILPERRKSMIIERTEKKKDMRKKNRSLSINDISFGEFFRVEHEGGKNKSSGFVNGRKLKNRMFKILKVKKGESSFFWKKSDSFLS